MSAAFSAEDPCIVCGAGMGHRPDEHADWCAEQAAFNASLGHPPAQFPAWYEQRLDARTPGHHPWASKS